MLDINTLALVGRLTKDAELKGSENPYLVFGIAVNRRVKKGESWEDEASFFDVQFFGKSAENMAKWLTKGKRIALKGELRQNRWEQDGKTHSRVFIVAQDLELLGDAKGGSEAAQEAPKGPGFNDDGIPF